MPQPTKTELARDVALKINAHLQRIERSPTLNPRRRSDQDSDALGTYSYFDAGATGVRHRVWIRYVSYQGGSYLSIEVAQKYLAWLDAGHVGRHYEVLDACDVGAARGFQR